MNKCIGLYAGLAGIVLLLMMIRLLTSFM